MSLAKAVSELGTSVRTLSRTLHERTGMSPMAFLRRRRLEAAHRDLFVADPEELRVADVALRYGSAHLGRFAVDYRRTFGERPSDTRAA